jgi:hypothetical protein
LTFFVKRESRKPSYAANALDIGLCMAEREFGRCTTVTCALSLHGACHLSIPAHLVRDLLKQNPCNIFNVAQASEGHSHVEYASQRGMFRERDKVALIPLSYDLFRVVVQWRVTTECSEL